ncbi:MAG: hypothetical protein ACU0BF_05910 [Paracoccaceae bacterium]
MFKFLFRKGDDEAGEPEVVAVPETQRQTVHRAVAEINEIIGGMDPKPAVTVEAGPGWLTVTLPEQMPDERPALPEPTPAERAKV